MKSLVILGASGSIGTQTISILKKNPKDFLLLGFSVGSRTRIISSLVSSFPSIKAICVKDNKKINYYSKKYPNIRFFSGDQGLLDLISYTKPEMVVNALVGFVGLEPTLFALEQDIKVALANKEALVVGGELVNKLLREGHGKIFPIDSEHSALWKCLSVDSDNVDKLIITASGGAFRKLSREELASVTPEDALKHPTWKMGNKITIDCATMVNKSFEIIEAYYLFGYKYNQIEVLLHDESYIHSMVKYNNGLYRADVNKPDMRNPIKHALYEGKNEYKTNVANDYHDFGNYHFHKFDISRYPMVGFADKVICLGGSIGAVYNAANEVAVYAFLNHEIPFLAIETIIEKCVSSHKLIKDINYDILAKIDAETRQFARNLVKKGEF